MAALISTDKKQTTVVPPHGRFNQTDIEQILGGAYTRHVVGDGSYMFELADHAALSENTLANLRYQSFNLQQLMPSRTFYGPVLWTSSAGD